MRLYYNTRQRENMRLTKSMRLIKDEVGKTINEARRRNGLPHNIEVLVDVFSY